ncbi:hypothetical protein PISMIDRAFT_109892 [Pisolithus microcarpus 441]|uniref:Uncharacterized protein n=1 Tax=Pisolithus microcarpus 441 TaxID=765257 RepID=A0A0C9Y0D8_9AGAM|nr:hypothetical protein PISMIDRAFT_109892 [Pisolithus microcarpus 441]
MNLHCVSRFPLPSASIQPDSFKTGFHPKSGHPTMVDSFSTFDRSQGRTQNQPMVDDNSQPWHPFQTHEDFEFSEIAHQAALNKDHMNKLLSLIQRIAKGEAKFTLQSHHDITEAWKCAAKLMTPFKKGVISILHQKQDFEFDVHFHPLWDWAMDLLSNPILMPHFVWDAQRLYKHNGERFEWFVDKPWMGNWWWNIQSDLLGDNAAPFAFILYADKSHLSSSGKVKAYPVIVQCRNLPVPADSGNKGKLSWTNLKCIVWHESFLKILDSIVSLSKVSFAYQTFEGTVRHLYPVILILSADYEEQCIMVLIRGLKSHCPCPICLVPSDQLCNHTSTYPMHMSLDAITSLEVYKRSWKDGEALMQKQSLQPVKNAFWHINHSDPHHALSFDHLHYDDMGMGDHLFKETKKNLAEIGHHAEKAVDDHHDAFPHWQNFNHFSSIMNIFFSDGNKLTDIVKQLPFTAQSVLSPRKHPIGFALLWCIASYLSYHMYIILNIHTETTIATGECELLAFQHHLEVNQTHLWPLIMYSIQKNRDFPKAHLAKHAFQDIIEKGAMQNYSTRPNKSHHGPIWKYYLHQTNQKDMPEQILQLDHWSLVSEFIHSWLDHDDEEHLKQMLDCRVLEDQENELLDDNVFSGHVYLGSPQPPIMIADVEKTFTLCPFQSFHKKLTHFLNEFLPLCDIPIPGGHSWFCYDCALIRTVNHHNNEKLTFVQFQFMFEYHIGGEALHLMLVTPFYFPPGERHAVDKGLHFICLRARPAALLEIIPLWSIIQGTLLVLDFANDGDYFLCNYTDGDIFLRSQTFLSYLKYCDISHIDIYNV